MTTERNYYRIMLGSKSKYAAECFDGEFIGGDWGINIDLSNHHGSWDEFNATARPVYFEINPDKSKVAAGLACGMLFTICSSIQTGDIVLCPNGLGSYHVGEVVEDYTYVPGGILPHRRSVNWYPNSIDRQNMSEALRNSAGSIGTVSNISKHNEEIESLLKGNAPPQLISTDELVEDPSVFALEKHLEEFLVQNWTQTELAQEYDIVEDDGELVGQQYPTDTGRIDVLAISKDKSEYLVIELKKGRASDAVVGQIQRYMGFVQDELTEEGQSVRGAIIALDDNLSIKRALSVAPNIEFYRYQVSFKLFKNNG